MPEDDKRKRKLNIFLSLLLLAGCAAWAVPCARFLNAIIGGGDTSLRSMCGAVLSTAMLIIIFLAVAAGLFASGGGHTGILTAGIILSAAVCLAAAAGAVYYAGTEEPVPSAVPASPRPTVTPPPVEIEQTVTENTNPESGTVFYRRYADNPCKLSVDNGSSLDLYMKFRDKSGRDTMIIYLRGGEAAEVKMPTGTYEILCAYGRKWVDEDELFGEKTRYKKGKSMLSFKWGKDYDLSFSAGLPELMEISGRDF